MKKFLLTIAVFTVVCAAIIVWAHWPTAPEEILLPQKQSDSNRSAILGTQPILLITDSRDSNTFAPYVSEILKAEGIFSFESLDAAHIPVTDNLLQKYDFVLTATNNASLDSNRSVLASYLASGGRLLMLFPSPAFDSLLGVRSAGETLHDGYITIDSSHHYGSGLTHSPLQFFGSARALLSVSSIPLARLQKTKEGSEQYVGAGLNSVGRGTAAFFAFDLGRSVVITRHGKPEQRKLPAQQDADGDGMFKTTDLFYHTFDYSNRSIPQADEQQKLLAKLVVLPLKNKLPIPRIWYFPKAHSSIALLTGDGHGPYHLDQANKMITYVQSRGGHFTLINYPDACDPELARSLSNAGHTLAPHLYYQRTSNRVMRLRQLVRSGFSPSYFFRPSFSDLRDEIEDGLNIFRVRTGDSVHISRTHYLVWVGWSETARLMAQYNILMDLSITGMNPFHPLDVSTRETWNSPGGFGYINGSGLPMKFVDPDGRPINLFSQLTLVEDDVMARECVRDAPDDSIATQQLVALNRRLINDGTDRYHSALVWNFHPEHLVTRWPPEAPTTWSWFTATVDYLYERKIPMLSANEWLAFTTSRYELSITNVRYNPATRLGSFTLFSAKEVNGITIHLPIPDNITTPATPKLQLTGARTQAQVPTTKVTTINSITYLELQMDLNAGDHLTIAYSF
jgi:hypothetical protein